MLPQSKFKISPEVISQLKQNQVTVTFLNDEDNRIFIFSGSAPLIWKYLEMGVKLDDLKAFLVSEWPLMNDEDWSGVKQFIDQLVNLKLLIAD